MSDTETSSSWREPLEVTGPTPHSEQDQLLMFCDVALSRLFMHEGNQGLEWEPKEGVKSFCLFLGPDWAKPSSLVLTSKLSLLWAGV